MVGPTGFEPVTEFPRPIMSRVPATYIRLETLNSIIPDK